MSNYLLVNQTFCNAHQGYKNLLNAFNFAVTTSGYYVVAERTINEFPELFENDTYLEGINIIALSREDFPTVLNPV